MFLANRQRRNITPCSFYSRKLAKAERNYKIYEKKMLAIVTCLTKWRIYLERAQPLMEVYTDHLNLTYFMTTKALNVTIISQDFSKPF